MAKKRTELLIPDKKIINKIILIRGQKVMIDKDLAELYGTTTLKLNQQVKRNLKRFPSDFMFRLTEKEKREVMSKNDHLKSLKYSPHLPYVFTEHGAVMLASILNSEKAILVNIQIVRVFTRFREMMLTNKDLLMKLERMEKEILKQDDKNKKFESDIQIVFTALKKMLDSPKPERKKVGYRRMAEE